MAVNISRDSNFLGKDLRGLILPVANPTVNSSTIYDSDTKPSGKFDLATMFPSPTNVYSNITFTNYNLGRTVNSMKGAVFSPSCSFNGTQLIGMTFEECSFLGAFMVGNVEMTSCSFHRCTFEKANFGDAIVMDCSFRGCTFEEANMAEITLEETTTFSNCVYDDGTTFPDGQPIAGFVLDPKMRRLTVSEPTTLQFSAGSELPFALPAGSPVKISNVTLYTSSPALANASSIDVIDPAGAVLGGKDGEEVIAQFSIPALPYEDYRWCTAPAKLDETRGFKEEQAFGSIFQNVDFGTTDLTGCVLDRCDLRGADLSEVTFLSTAPPSITRAIYNDETTWPTTGNLDVSAAIHATTGTFDQHIPDSGHPDWPSYADLSVAVEETITADTMRAGTLWNGLDLRHQLYTAENSMRGVDARGADLRSASLSATYKDWRMVIYDDATQWSELIASPEDILAENEDALAKADAEGNYDLYGKEFTLVSMAEWNKISGIDWKGTVHAAREENASLYPSAVYPGADLTGAQFDMARPIRIFDATTMTNLNLSGASILIHATGVDFQGMTVTASTRLEGTFEGCSFQGVNFSGCTLSNLTLRECDLTGASMDGCQLGASSSNSLHIVKCNLSGCSFDEAKAVHASIEENEFPLHELAPTRDGKGLTFTSVRFPSSLADVVLEGATLSHCTMEDIDMKESSMQGCKMTGCSLRRSDLRHANLKLSEESENNSIEGALLDDETLVLDGTTKNSAGEDVGVHGLVDVSLAKFCTASDPVASLAGIQVLYSGHDEGRSSIGVTEDAAPGERDLSILEMDGSDYRGSNFLHCDLSEALLSSDPTQLENSYYDNRTTWPDSTMHDDITIEEQLQYTFNVDLPETYLAKDINGVRLLRNLCGADLSAARFIPEDLSFCLIDDTSAFPEEVNATSRGAIFVSTDTSAAPNRVSLDGDDFSRVDFRTTNRGNSEEMAFAVSLNVGAYAIIAKQPWTRHLSRSFAAREAVSEADIRHATPRIESATKIMAPENAMRLTGLRLTLEPSDAPLPQVGEKVAIVSASSSVQDVFSVTALSASERKIDLSCTLMNASSVTEISRSPFLFHVSPVFYWADGETEARVAVVRGGQCVRESLLRRDDDVTMTLPTTVSAVQVQSDDIVVTIQDARAHGKGVSIFALNTQGDRIAVADTMEESRSSSSTVTVHQPSFADAPVVVTDAASDELVRVLPSGSFDPTERTLTLPAGGNSAEVGQRIYADDVYLGPVASVSGDEITLGLPFAVGDTILFEKDAAESALEDPPFRLLEADVRIEDDGFVARLSCDSIPTTKNNRAGKIIVVEPQRAETAAPSGAPAPLKIASVRCERAGRVVISLEGNADLEVGRMAMIHDPSEELSDHGLRGKTGKIIRAVSGACTLILPGAAVFQGEVSPLQNVGLIMDAYSLTAAFESDESSPYSSVADRTLTIVGSAGRYPLTDYYFSLWNEDASGIFRPTAEGTDRLFIAGVVYDPDTAHVIDFEMCSANGTDFTDAQIMGVSFDGADLRRANFSGCEARKADFENIIIDTATVLPFFVDGRPSNMILFDADDNKLKNASLVNADLSAIDASELPEQPFESCVYLPGHTKWFRLDDGSFMTDEEAVVRYTEGMYILGKTHESTGRPNFELADLSGVDLSAVQGPEQAIRNALQFSTAHFFGADLTDCRFPAGTIISESDLRTCSLAFAKDVVCRRCFIDEDTILPTHCFRLCADTASTPQKLTVCDAEGNIFPSYESMPLSRGTSALDLTLMDDPPATFFSAQGLEITFLLREDAFDNAYEVSEEEFIQSWTASSETPSYTAKRVLVKISSNVTDGAVDLIVDSAGRIFSAHLFGSYETSFEGDDGMVATLTDEEGRIAIDGVHNLEGFNLSVISGSVDDWEGSMMDAQTTYAYCPSSNLTSILSLRGTAGLEDEWTLTQGAAEGAVGDDVAFLATNGMLPMVYSRFDDVEYTYMILKDELYRKPELYLDAATTLLAVEATAEMRVRGSVEEEEAQVNGETRYYYRVRLIIPNRRHEEEKGYAQVHLSGIRLRLYGVSPVTGDRLPYVDLAGREVSWDGCVGEDYSQKVLTGLRGSHAFVDAQFFNADLSQIDFNRITFENCDLRACNLTGIRAVDTSVCFACDATVAVPLRKNALERFTLSPRGDLFAVELKSAENDLRYVTAGYPVKSSVEKISLADLGQSVSLIDFAWRDPESNEIADIVIDCGTDGFFAEGFSSTVRLLRIIPKRRLLKDCVVDSSTLGLFPEAEVRYAGGMTGLAPVPSEMPTDVEWTYKDSNLIGTGVEPEDNVENCLVNNNQFSNDATNDVVHFTYTIDSFEVDASSSSTHAAIMLKRNEGGERIVACILFESAIVDDPVHFPVIVHGAATDQSVAAQQFEPEKEIAFAGESNVRVFKLRLPAPASGAEYENLRWRVNGSDVPVQVTDFVAVRSGVHLFAFPNVPLPRSSFLSFGAFQMENVDGSQTASVTFDVEAGGLRVDNFESWASRLRHTA